METINLTPFIYLTSMVPTKQMEFKCGFAQSFVLYIKVLNLKNVLMIMSYYDHFLDLTM